MYFPIKVLFTREKLREYVKAEEKEKPRLIILPFLRSYFFFCFYIGYMYTRLYALFNFALKKNWFCFGIFSTMRTIGPVKSLLGINLYNVTDDILRKKHKYQLTFSVFWQLFTFRFGKNPNYRAPEANV